MDRIQQTLLHYLWEGKKESELVDAVWQALRAQGQLLVVDGKRLETEKENVAELQLQLKNFKENTLPQLEVLGIYERT